MNTIEHLLTSLAEEGAEITHAATKILRFGLLDRYPNNLYVTNEEKLINELNDLVGVVQMLVEEGVIPPLWAYSDRIAAKKEKVRKYLEYAKQKGTLE